jgi:hypothetical protein
MTMLGEGAAAGPRVGRIARAWETAATLAAAHWPLAAALAVVAVVGLPTLNFAYGPDQALFTYIGRALARGQTLYVDVWDVKPPAVFWVYTLAGNLPGGFRGLRAFDLLYTLVTVAAVYALGRCLWDRATGATAGLLYGVAYVTASGYWNMAQPDSFLVLPVVLGVLLWEMRPRSRPGSSRRADDGRAVVLAGLLFGLAFQFRSVTVLFPAVLVLHEGWDAERRAGAVRRGLLLAAGFAAFQVLTLAYLALGGAVGEYLYAQFRFARHYSRLGGPYAWDRLTVDNYLGGLRGALMWFGASRLLLTGPALAALLVGGVLRADRGVRLTALLLLAAVAGVAVQAKFFIYHWQPAVPFLALPAAWTVVVVWRALRARLALPAAAATMAAATGTLLLFTPQVTDPGVREWRDVIRFAREPSYRGIYYDRFGLWGHGTYSYRASEEVGRYIRARTRPGDTVFVWGYDPNFYLVSERASPSRFTSFLPLMPTFTPESWRQEFVRDLETKKPAYILLQRGENARWITGLPDDSAEWVVHFAAFNDLLARDYEFDRRIEDYFIYRRR